MSGIVGEKTDSSDDQDTVLEMDVVPTPTVSPRPDAPVVLVVDDDPDIRNIMVRALGAAHTVYEANDGEEASAILEAIPAPDAIVCDIMMPRQDGLTFAQHLRKDKVLKRIPILFLTAKSGALDVIAGINVGARHYVIKPFKVAELVAKVTAMTAKPNR